LLVRVTARISAALLSAGMFAAARRIAAPVRAERRRRVDAGLLVALIASHTIHFACVALLTIATAGENVRLRGGYVLVTTVGVGFYLACAAALRAKLRRGSRWETAAQRGTELTALLLIWLAFAQVYVLRIGRSPLFAMMSVVMLAALAALVTGVIRNSELGIRKERAPLS
jgi:hypothetical protein